MAPAAAPPASPPAGVRHRVPMHPGRFLDRHFLKPLAISQTEAARRLGVSRRRVHELVHGERAMSPDTALRCAEAFGLSVVDWLAMQAAWDAWGAWQAQRRATQLPTSALSAVPAHG